MRKFLLGDLTQIAALMLITSAAAAEEYKCELETQHGIFVARYSLPIEQIRALPIRLPGSWFVPPRANSRRLYIRRVGECIQKSANFQSPGSNAAEAAFWGKE